jgi:hypothetical protein
LIGSHAILQQSRIVRSPAVHSNFNRYLALAAADILRARWGNRPRRNRGKAHDGPA